MEEKKKQRQNVAPGEEERKKQLSLTPGTSSDCNQASVILVALERERMVPTMRNLSAVAPKI